MSSAPPSPLAGATFLGAGALWGLAFVDERLQPLAWLGVALLTLAIRRADRRTAFAGLLLAPLIAQSLAQHWLVLTIESYLSLSRFAALLLALLVFLLSSLVVQAPALLALHRWGPRAVRFWLPPCWVAGEALRTWCSEYAMTDLLHSQWACAPVLRCLALVGWYPTLLALLLAATFLGELLHARRARSLVVPAVLAVALLAMPRPAPNDAALEGVGAVHLRSLDALDAPPGPPPPSGWTLLVWPEGFIRGNHRLPEGQVTAAAPLSVFDPALARLAPLHVLGLSLVADGHRLNAAAIADSARRITATRGKSVLVPLVERPFWGLPAAGGAAFAPGRIAPVLPAGPRRLITLVCYEAFSRAIVARGRAAGGDLLVAISSDRPLVDSPVAHRQAVGALVLRAVESRLPAVRAALGGHAAIISADGRVLVRSVWDSDGVVVAPARRDD